MPVYINGIGAITPQQTFGSDENVRQRKFPVEGRLNCVEPDYSVFIDAKAIRRMSRIIRMAVWSSGIALQDAALDNTEAIIVGTALGCLEDTVSFLNKMVLNKEELLNPTAFIHSTHNTIASQIALRLKCNAYNSTYVHRNLSFESALDDAMLLLEEGSIQTALLGGIDELTDVSFEILRRLGYYSEQKKRIGGEGSAFFSISGKKNEGTYAEIAGLLTLSFLKPEQIKGRVNSFLQSHNITDVDMIFSGLIGEEGESQFSEELYQQIVKQNNIFYFKEYCGEYATAAAFAMYMAARTLREISFPAFVDMKNSDPGSVRTILIHNHFNHIHHSFILLKAC